MKVATRIIRYWPRGACLLFCVLFSTVVHGRALLLQEDRFETDVAGWMAAGAPDSQVTWDGDSGNPAPGSLLLSTVEGSDVENYKAVGQCVPADGGQTYSVEAQVNPALQDHSGSCFAVPVFYDEPDCQGEGSVGGTGDQVSQGGWQREVSAVRSFESSRSVRVELVMRLDGGTGPAECRFDSVGLYEGRLVEPVPALSAAGVGIVVLGLGLAAVFARRQRSWR